MKTLGVLGGMGPQASLRFYDLLIQISEEKYGAKTNDGYPHILLSNLPVPDLISDKEQEEKAVGMVEEEARRLVQAGADLFALPCNTMHLYLDRYEKAAGKPFVSMVKSVTEKVIAKRHTCVGILGTPTTMIMKLYTPVLEQKGIKTVYIEEKSYPEVGRIIKKIISNSFSENDRQTLQRYIKDLQSKGAQAVVLGCTELPLVLQKDETLPLYDSLAELAAACCKEIFKKPGDL